MKKIKLQLGKKSDFSCGSCIGKEHSEGRVQMYESVYSTFNLNFILQIQESKMFDTFFYT